MCAYSVYVHIPYCRSRCIYCDFSSSTSALRQEADQRAYVDAVAREFAYRLGALAKTPSFHTLYIGGGTPSLLSTHLLSQLVSRLLAYGDFSEVTVEANPKDVDAHWFAAMLTAGVTRFSIGVQSLDGARLRFLGRRHNVQEARDAIDGAMAAGASNISADLMYGTPGQTVEQLAREAEAFAALPVQHVSAYELTVTPGTPLYDMKELTYPSDDVLADMWQLLGDIWAPLGLERYEVSNYARPGFQSRHNNHYWRGGCYWGLGAGAHGFVQHGSIQPGSQRVRYENGADVARYVAQLTSPVDLAWQASEETITAEMLAQEMVMLGLRCRQGIDAVKLAKLVGEQSNFMAQLHRWRAEGRLTFDGQFFRPTQTTMGLADELALTFF